MEVSLKDILNARDARVQQQNLLLSQYGTPMLCFTMNIAGPVKTSPLIERGFRAGLAALDRQIPQDQILYREIQLLPTGCEAMYAVSMPAWELKTLCTAIEEENPLGRLFDMDVLDIDGRKLERNGTRDCIVCGAPGRTCAATRAHPVEQLQTATTQILEEHFRKADRKQIASMAVQSLLKEVDTTPKPGLVDRRNNGSHKDMDLGHFIASAKALGPYFAQCVEIGQNTAAASPEATFSLLRQAGLEAEKTMYQATGGVNTHKGAVYTLGVLCGSIGRLWSPETPIANTEMLLTECARLVSTSVQADLAFVDGKTAGERLYLNCGMRGIRGEVADGLPSVNSIGLPSFRQALKNGLSENDAGVYALLQLIANVDDTNLHHRGGLEGAKWATKTVQELLSATPIPTMAQVEALDDAFILRNLSPGGCADLLAVTYFLHDLCIR